MNNVASTEEYFSEMKEIIEKMPRDDLEQAIELLFEAWKNERQVFVMGNGGSASTATHFVCDLAKYTTTNGKKRFKAIGLTDNMPLYSAWVNDEGFENVFVEQLKNLVNEGDLVVAFSVHGGTGWSTNLIKAIEYANGRSCVTIGFSGFDGGKMAEIATCCVVVPARSTPQVESFHSVLAHMICECLRERIRNFTER